MVTIEYHIPTTVISYLLLYSVKIMDHLVAREGTTAPNAVKSMCSSYDDNFKLMVIKNVEEINCATNIIEQNI
jgi:hypothetical protein